MCFPSDSTVLCLLFWCHLNVWPLISQKQKTQLRGYLCESNKSLSIFSFSSFDRNWVCGTGADMVLGTYTSIEHKKQQGMHIQLVSLSRGRIYCPAWDCTQPCHVQQYQMHVFAPVVTGTPMKKPKYSVSESSIGGGECGCLAWGSWRRRSGGSVPFWGF